MYASGKRTSFAPLAAASRATSSMRSMVASRSKTTGSTWAQATVTGSFIRRFSRNPSRSACEVVLGSPQALLPKGEDLNDLGVELRTALTQDLVDRALPAQLPVIRPLARHRIEGVGEGEDARAKGDLVSLEAVRIAAPVPALVVRADHLQAFAVQQRDVAEQLGADHRMLLHEKQLRGAQRSFLVEDRVRHPDLADVVQQEAVLEARIVEQARFERLGQLERVAMNAQRMPPRRLVSHFERVRQGGNRLAVGVLQQPPLCPLDLSEPAEVTGVREQLVGTLRLCRIQPL